MKIPKIKPRGKQILVQQDGKESRETKSGLFVPSNVETEQKAFGIVMGVGDGIKDVKKGDRVIFGAYAGEKLKFKDGSKDIELVLLFDEDVIAFIEE
jgi:co-chaperonin GroES (HSP10)